MLAGDILFALISLKNSAMSIKIKIAGLLLISLLFSSCKEEVKSVGIYKPGILYRDGAEISYNIYGEGGATLLLVAQTPVVILPAFLVAPEVRQTGLVVELELIVDQLRDRAVKPLHQRLEVGSETVVADEVVVIVHQGHDPQHELELRAVMLESVPKDFSRFG